MSFQERAWASNGLEEERWAELEAALSAPPPGGLVEWLTHLGLVEQEVGSTVTSLAGDPGGKGVPVPGPVSDAAVQLLAAGHSRGGTRNLVVPYIPDGLEVALG